MFVKVDCVVEFQSVAAKRGARHVCCADGAQGLRAKVQMALGEPVACIWHTGFGWSVRADGPLAGWSPAAHGSLGHMDRAPCC